MASNLMFNKNNSTQMLNYYPYIVNVKFTEVNSPLLIWIDYYHWLELHFANLTNLLHE